jgi:hypothetical protein
MKMWVKVLLFVPLAFWHVLGVGLGGFIWRGLWVVVRHIPPRQPPWPAYRVMLRERHALRHGYDLTWGRHALTLVSVTTTVNAVGWMKPGLALAATIADVVFGFLLTAYFAHLLFRRLQCSLLEWCLIIAVLGNAMGLILTTPGLERLSATGGALGLLVSGWVLYGAVVGLAQAKLLGLRHALARLGVLILAWLRIASPALLAGGAVLVWGSRWGVDSRWVSAGMHAWGAPLLAFGLVGLVLGGALEWKAARAAREVLRAKLPLPAEGV